MTAKLRRPGPPRTNNGAHLNQPETTAVEQRMYIPLHKDIYGSYDVYIYIRIYICICMM